MTPTDIFYTYEKVDGKNVILGNNDTCKVMDTGNVLIKMHDGILRTLRDVRHVSGVEK